MTDQWPSKKEYEAALRQIHTRLGAVAAAVAAGGNMVYTTAATDTHSGAEPMKPSSILREKGKPQFLPEGR